MTTKYIYEPNGGDPDASDVDHLNVKSIRYWYTRLTAKGATLEQVATDLGITTDDVRKCID